MSVDPKHRAEGRRRREEIRLSAPDWMNPHPNSVLARAQAVPGLQREILRRWERYLKDAYAYERQLMEAAGVPGGR